MLHFLIIKFKINSTCFFLMPFRPQNIIMQHLTLFVYRLESRTTIEFVYFLHMISKELDADSLISSGKEETNYVISNNRLFDYEIPRQFVNFIQ